MKYSLSVVQKARDFRRKGLSFAEIAKRLKTAKSTASVWTTDVKLNAHAKERLLNRSVNGRLKSVAFFKKKKLKELQVNQKMAKIIVNSLRTSRDLSKVVCSLLYWCEGSKKGLIKFTSSDPNLIKIFLKHLRNGFDIDNKKFRALMHLHQYHNEEKQRLFWQNATNIPPSQFNRTFWKPNTGKNIRPDYPGCLAVSYMNAKVAREIRAIYNAFGYLKIGT